MRDSTGNKETAGREREERLLSELMREARDETWDARPGFEARLMARIRDESGAPSFDPVRLIWRAVPAAAAVALLAIAFTFLVEPVTTVQNFVVSSMTEPVLVDDLISLGLF